MPRVSPSTPRDPGTGYGLSPATAQTAFGYGAGGTGTGTGTGTGRPGLNELTPVIRNTSGSMDDGDLDGPGGGGAGAGGEGGGTRQPPSVRSTRSGPGRTRRPPILELQMPTGHHLMPTGMMGGPHLSLSQSLPPRPGSPPTLQPSRQVHGLPPPARPAAAPPSPPPPIGRVGRSHSAGNLDAGSLARTVRDYYARGGPSDGGRGHDLAVSSREDLAIRRALADVGASMGIDVPAAAATGAHSLGGLPQPRGGAAGRGASASASASLSASISSGPEQYQPTRIPSLQGLGRVDDSEGLRNIFKEGSSPPRRLKSSPYECRVLGGGQPVTPGGRGQASDFHSNSAHSNSAHSNSAHSNSAHSASSPASLRRPIPLEERDWSIPSIRLAHHFHNSGSESCTTHGTYEDESTLGCDEEDDLHLHMRAEGGSSGGGYHDDGTLSSRSSMPLLLPAGTSQGGAGVPFFAPSPEATLMMQETDDEDAEQQGAIVIESGLDVVSHHSASVAGDSVGAVAPADRSIPPEIFRVGGAGGDEDGGPAAAPANSNRRKRKSRRSGEEAMRWLGTVEVGGVAEAASSKFLGASFG